MNYEIQFTRITVEDQRTAKTESPLTGGQCRELITKELGNAEIKILPVLSDWTHPEFDVELGRYKISAFFNSLLSLSEVEELFRLVSTRGLTGDFFVWELT
jgi:hypothetical protein